MPPDPDNAAADNAAASLVKASDPLLRGEARRDAPRTEVALSGPCTIAEAEAIHARLMSALNKTPGGCIEITCDAVTDIDLTFIQILIAARRSAEEAGIRLVLASPAQGTLAQALVTAGLAHPHGLKHGWLNPLWAGE